MAENTSLCALPNATLPFPECPAILLSYGIVSLMNIVYGIIVLFILTFTQDTLQRQCCKGLLGIPIPLNMLTVTKHRFVYTLIFGIMASTVFEILTLTLPITVESRVVSSLISLLIRIGIITLLAVFYYPLFAGVNSNIPLVGYIMGSLSALMVLAWNATKSLVTYGGCLNCRPEGVILAFTILADSFVVVCIIIVLLWYLFRTFKEVHDILRYSKPLRESDSVENQLFEYHFERVHRILRQKPGTTRPWIHCLNKIYKFNPGYKYPLRFMAAMILSFYFLYRLTLIGLTLSIQIGISITTFQQRLQSVFDDTRASQLLGKIDISGLANSTEKALNIIEDIIHGGLTTITVVLPLSTVLATGFSIISVISIYLSISDHIQKISKSDLSFLPQELPALKSRLASAVHYPGYQAAYILWAWLIYIILLILIGTALSVLVFLIKYATNFILDVIFSLGLILAWLLAIIIFKHLMVQFVFTKRADLKEENLIINNRRLYHVFAYVMFFLDAFIGLLSSLVRILYTVLFGLILLARMDRVILMRGFERFDGAHKSYIGFIYLEYIQNNSIMNVFVKLLQDSINQNVRKKKKKLKTNTTLTPTNDSCDLFQEDEKVQISEDAQVHQIPEVGGIELKNITADKCFSYPSRECRVSKMAYNRWMVAYTLLRNEKLIMLRGGNLKENELSK